ncbi:MAG TPA: TetR/AcrR family transcriptional regulator [Candidatus Acidoferrales bacterium]|jgi:AcrR family transcriptional regulator|nr:TetR/AcrR family transcriptional regulator [Candidatus Acidoferrales bacterium]
MSVTQARKDRERAEREELILDHAQRSLLKDGFQNLNLDDLAKAVEYSKGTLYLHFKTKEDIALAVATRAIRERADLFERAMVFKGSSRERMRAIGFASLHFAHVYPDYFSVELMLKSQSFWEKADPLRQQGHGMEGARCFRAVHRIVTEAIETGDLTRGQLSPEEIVFAIASTAIGSHIMGRSSHAGMFVMQDPLKMVCQNVDILLDGLGWKPLSKDMNPDAVDRRIKREVFPEATWFKPS